MHLRRALSVLLITPVILAGAGCGRAADGAETTVAREPVAYAGDHPFSAAVGADDANVTVPDGAGGTLPGDTVGLYGGTRNEATCDKGQLASFLGQDKAKAAAWAGVLGVSVTDVQAYVGSLTPAVLRTDTRVTNHGFRDGKAYDIPAVLQAGTAVLIDVHGAPVAKCFCGNPLTPPAALRNVSYTGPTWNNFEEKQVTVIAPVTQNVQQFVFVEPGSGRSFQRPAGSGGRQDANAPAPAPSRLAPPATPVPPPTASGTSAPSNGGPPPGNAVPSASPPSPTPTIEPPTPTTGPPSPTTGSPSPTVTPSGTASGNGAPSPAPSVVRASWGVGDCYVKDHNAHALVSVRPDGTTAHTFTMTVRVGSASAPAAIETVTVPAEPGQIASTEVNEPTTGPDGSVQCEVLTVVDENGQTPIKGDVLPPPPESSPMPGQPGPGVPSETPLTAPPSAPSPGASPTAS